MADRIFKRRRIAGEPGIDQCKTAAWLDGVLINIVEATRAWRPLQPGVEQGQHQQAEPENGHRVAQQGKGANRQIPRRTGVTGAQHPGDDAQYRADDQRQGRQLKGRREDRQQIVEHRLAGSAGDAKIAMGQVDQVVPELHRQRLVETQLMANLVIGRLAGMVADDLQYAVDGRQRGEREGDQQQPEQREQQRKQPLQQAGKVSGKRWHGKWKFLIYQYCTRRRDADRARVRKRSSGQTRPPYPVTKPAYLVTLSYQTMSAFSPC